MTRTCIKGEKSRKSIIIKGNIYIIGKGEREWQKQYYKRSKLIYFVYENIIENIGIFKGW